MCIVYFSYVTHTIYTQIPTQQPITYLPLTQSYLFLWEEKPQLSTGTGIQMIVFFFIIFLFSKHFSIITIFIKGTYIRTICYIIVLPTGKHISIMAGTHFYTCIHILIPYILFIIYIPIVVCALYIFFKTTYNIHIYSITIYVCICVHVCVCSIFITPLRITDDLHVAKYDGQFSPFTFLVL